MFEFTIFSRSADGLSPKWMTLISDMGADGAVKTSSAAFSATRGLRMSRTAIAIFGLMAVAGINVLGPAVAQRISQAVGYERQDRGMGTDLQLAIDSRPADRAGWDSHTLLDGR